MEDNEFCCYEFDRFRLDVRRRSLSKNGEKIPLSARNFDLLRFMVENSGRILEHDELLEKVWARTFVEQATLKKGISALRQILAETPETEFIKTIPRRGYSFVSPVRAVPEENQNFVVRETEHQIIVEELELTDVDEKETAPLTISPFELKELPPVQAKRISVSQLAIFGSAGVIALALLFSGVKPYFTKDVKPPFAAETIHVDRVTNNGNIVFGAMVSPDGNYLLYPVEEKREGYSLWLRQLATNSVSRLTAPQTAGFWAFGVAPDNSYVYYVLGESGEKQPGGLYKIPLLGGEPQRIAGNVSSMAISPDNTKIAIVRLENGTRIFTVNPNGEQEKLVTALPADYRLWNVNWTPDGKNLLCTISKMIDDKFIFYVAEIVPETGSETIVVPPSERVVYSAAWLPDKSSLVLIGRETNADIRQIWHYFPISREWRRATNDNASYQAISLTSDGRQIAAMQTTRMASIWLADTISSNSAPDKNQSAKNQSAIALKNFRQITGGANYFDRLAWLANERIAYSATENGKESIFVVNSDGGFAKQITTGNDGIWLRPTAAGDGRGVSFFSSRSGKRQQWLIDADGKNPAKLPEIDLPVIAAQLLHDNSTLIYQTQTKAGEAILFRRKADGQTIRLTDSDSHLWAISPDEKLLAVNVWDASIPRKNRIEVRSLEDGTTVNAFDFAAARRMRFTPDNANLIYDLRVGDISQIMLQPVRGGAPRALTDFQSDEIFDFDWSPDGTRLAIIRGKQLNDAVLVF